LIASVLISEKSKHKIKIILVLEGKICRFSNR